MIPLYYDLHIHSCLSPCGDDDMTPANIAGMAALKGLEAVALTDHNTARNCPAFMEAGEEYGLLCIPGMELTTEEEVHVLCLFEDLKAALEFDRYVYSMLIQVPNKSAVFGNQFIYGADDKVIGTEPNLLINATRIEFEHVYEKVTEYGGVMVPAHVEKTSNSIISNLGFFPPDSMFTTIELKNMGKLHEVAAANPYARECGVITDSDAHYLGDINEAVNTIYVKDRSAKAVLNALRKKQDN